MPSTKKLALDPSSLTPYSHSAAGHEGISSNATGTLLIKPCTQPEIDFYTLASTDPAHAAFYAHMPTFMGSLSAASEQDQAGLQQMMKDGEGVRGAMEEPGTHGDGPVDGPVGGTGEGGKEGWKPSGGKKLSTGLMLAISNAAAGITRPCVLDVKLGARLWDDDAPLAKRKKLDEVSNETTSGSLGFRVAGMKVYGPGEDEEKHCVVKEGTRTYDKFYGRDFNAENVWVAFEMFLGGMEGGKLRRKYAKEVLGRFVREVESIENMLRNEESRMYSASILMVYEGDDEALEKALEFEKKKGAEEEDEEEDEEEEGDDDDEADPKVHDVCLIDFAHAKFVPGEGPDENALQGVKSVLKILKSLG